MELYEVYRVDYKLEENLKLIIRKLWLNTTLEERHFQSIWKRRRNLEGALINVATIYAKPFLYEGDADALSQYTFQMAHSVPMRNGKVRGKYTAISAIMIGGEFKKANADWGRVLGKVAPA